jgi:phage tail sheath protein FI
MKKTFLLLLFMICVSVCFSQTRSSQRSRASIKAKTRVELMRDSIVKGIDNILDTFTRHSFTPATWNKIKSTTDSYLYQFWVSGNIMGKGREEGYFVKCDLTVMTQTDIREKRLVVEVGIALIKPAEFEILRFQRQLR